MQFYTNISYFKISSKFNPEKLEIFEKWKSAISFDISDFPTGIYMVRLFNSDQNMVKKIVLI